MVITIVTIIPTGNIIIIMCRRALSSSRRESAITAIIGTIRVRRSARTDPGDGSTDHLRFYLHRFDRIGDNGCLIVSLRHFSFDHNAAVGLE